MYLGEGHTQRSGGIVMLDDERPQSRLQHPTFPFMAESILAWLCCTVHNIGD